LTPSATIGDEREVDEADEHEVEFLESREDAPETLGEPSTFGPDSVSGGDRR
jgi:hypothetical protein